MTGRTTVAWLFILFLVAGAAGVYVWYRYSDAGSFNIDSNGPTGENFATIGDFLDSLKSRSDITCSMYQGGFNGANVGEFMLSDGSVRMDFRDLTTGDAIHELINDTGMYVWNDTSDTAVGAGLDTPMTSSGVASIPVVDQHSCEPLWHADPSLFKVPDSLVIQMNDSSQQ